MKRLLFLSLLFTFSCTVSKESILLKVLEKQYQLPEKCAILLIPNAGCTGCISDAERFTSENLSSQKLFINMVDLRSKKLIKQKMGVDFLLNPRVKIDQESKVKQSAKVSIFPKIIYIQERKITKIVEASPEYEGNAWQELKDYLNTQK